MENNENLENNEKNTDLKEQEILIKEIQKLKETTVPKEKYDEDTGKLKEQNQVYLKAITEGGKITQSEEDKKTKLTDDIKEMAKFKGTNLEFWEKQTKLIDRTIKETPKDVLIDTIGDSNLNTILKVNQKMKEMVEAADGDPDAFISAYRREIQDSAPNISQEISKAGGLVNYLVDRQENNK